MCGRCTEVVCYSGVRMLPPLKSQILPPPLFPEERQDLPYTIRGIIQPLEHLICFIFSHLYGELFSYFSCCCIYFNTLEDFDKQVVTHPCEHSGRIGKYNTVYCTLFIRKLRQN